MAVTNRQITKSPKDLLAVPGWGLKNHEFTAKFNKRIREQNLILRTDNKSQLKIEKVIPIS
ncbi:hypothetical protein FACS189451_01410 [Bacteroidia bacterium]|nr:hypothetical protein FACS189451_01410 [Bacteroidia bacterium]